MSEGLDRHDAIHAIGSVLAGHMTDLVRVKDAESALGESESRREPNETYFVELEALTVKGWRRSA